MTLGQALSKLSVSPHYLNIKSNDITIRVGMKGESTEAHAEAILAYFGFSKSNEDTFKAKYGYDLRQSLVNAYRKSDNRSAHKLLGGGYVEVLIPLPKVFVEQIKSIQNPISSNLANGSGSFGSVVNSNVIEGDLMRPTLVPKNATPAEQDFYRALDLFKTEALNFGQRGASMGDIRADYLKTIKFASNEFVEMVESGRISYEEGALRANKLRNVLFEISRRKDWDLGRSLAEYTKPEAKPFEYFLEKYSQQRFS